MDLPAQTVDKIARLYGSPAAPQITRDLAALLDRYADLPRAAGADFLTERDIMLIAYADSLHQTGKQPLNSLNLFAHQRLKDIISIIHILPFFPYSSDDGFSVIDYRTVDPDLGDWRHIRQLAREFQLSFDLVINHASARSRYFRNFLKDVPEYQDFFITADPQADTAAVVRPRTLPLLHSYKSASGPRWCWTTFSPDQIDFNFKNPAVLLEMLDILLFYVTCGARIIRLDAIAYLWKQLGASCIHLPQTHLVVQLIRDVFDLLAPQVLILTETNVPHAENISYFGDGANEAQIVYNFPLPPLILHTFTAGDARHLTRWARTIEPVSDRTTFLNFTASHDGIGVRPAADLLTDDEFLALVDLTTRHGGQVSYKNDQDGNPIPYELNINYFDALNDPNDPHEDLEIAIERFICSQAIAMALLGIPGIYIHSLLGSRNWTQGVAKTGHPRTINREKPDFDLIEQQLHDEFSRRARVFNRYRHLITIRRQQKAFHPNAAQHILDLASPFFGLIRTACDGSEMILALYNVTGRPQTIDINADLFPTPHASPLTNVLNGQELTPTSPDAYSLTLTEYQFLWLRANVS